MSKTQSTADVDQFVIDFYSKYGIELTPEKVDYIHKTYGDDYNTLINDLYGKYAPGQLTDEKYDFIETNYGLKKNGAPSGQPSGPSKSGIPFTGTPPTDPLNPYGIPTKQPQLPAGGAPVGQDQQPQPQQQAPLKPHSFDASSGDFIKPEVKMPEVPFDPTALKGKIERANTLFKAPDKDTPIDVELLKQTNPLFKEEFEKKQKDAKIKEHIVLKTAGNPKAYEEWERKMARGLTQSEEYEILSEINQQDIAEKNKNDQLLKQQLTEIEAEGSLGESQGELVKIRDTIKAIKPDLEMQKQVVDRFKIQVDLANQQAEPYLAIIRRDEPEMQGLNDKMIAEKARIEEFEAAKELSPSMYAEYKRTVENYNKLLNEANGHKEYFQAIDKLKEMEAKNAPLFDSYDKAVNELNGNVDKLNAAGEQYNQILAALEESGYSEAYSKTLDALEKNASSYEKIVTDQNELIKKYPEVYKRYVDQNRADKMYEIAKKEGGGMFATMLAVESASRVWNFFTEGIASSMIATNQSLGLGNAKTNELIDKMVDGIVVTVPQQKVYDKKTGEYDLWRLIPYGAEQAANIAMLIRGGKLFGGGKAGLVTTAYLTQYNSVRKEALAAGLSPADAAMYAMPVAAGMALLEVIMPDSQLVFGSKQMLASFVKNIAKDRNLAFKSVTDQLKKMLLENAEEFSQNAYQKFANMATNQMVGSKMQETMTEEETINTALITSPVAFFAGIGNIRTNSNREMNYQIGQLALNPDLTAKAIEENLAAGIITEDEAQQLTEKVEKYGGIMKKMPPELSPEKKIEVAPIIEEIEDLEAKKKGLSEQFAKLEEAKIKKLEEEFEAKMGVTEENPVGTQVEENTDGLGEDRAAAAESTPVEVGKIQEVEDEKADIAEDIKFEEEWIENQKKPGLLKKIGEKLAGVDRQREIKRNKKKLELLESNPEKYFADELARIDTYNQENPEDAFSPEYRERYAKGLEKLKEQAAKSKEELPSKAPETAKNVKKEGEISPETVKDEKVSTQKAKASKEPAAEVVEDVAGDSAPVEGGFIPSAIETALANDQDLPFITQKGIEVEFAKHKDGIRIESIANKTGEKGNASPVLKEITDHADKLGIPIYLDAVAKPKGLSQTELENWYKRNGFVFKEGSTQAVRLPQMPQIDKDRTNKEAQALGWTSAPHALKSIKSRIGVDYAKWDDVPMEIRDSISKQRQIQKEGLEPKSSQESDKSVEGKKAEIEKRRGNELAVISDLKPNTKGKVHVDVGGGKFELQEFTVAANGKVVFKGQKADTPLEDISKEINAKYDAELKALESPVNKTVTNTPVTPKSEPAPKPAEKSKIEIAREKVAAAKAAREKFKGLGVADDPKARAKADFSYHKALVELALAYIETGVKKASEFAKAEGLKFTKTVNDAWKEARGAEPKTLEDFEKEAEAPKKKKKKKTKSSGKKKKYEQRELKEYANKEKLLEAVKAKGLTYEPVSWKKVNPIADEIMAEAVADPDTVDQTFEAISRVIENTTGKEYKENDDLSTLHSLIFHKIIAHYREAGDMKNFMKWSGSYSDTARWKARFISAMQADSTPEAIANRIKKVMEESKAEAMNREGENGTVADDIKDIQDKLKLTEEEIARLQAIIDNLNKQRASRPAPAPAAPKAPSVTTANLDPIKAKRKEAISQIKQALKRQRGQMNMGVNLMGDRELLSGVRKLIESYIQEGVYRVKQLKAKLKKAVDDQDLWDEISDQWDRVYNTNLKGMAKQAQAEDFIRMLEERGKANARTPGRKAKDPIDILLDTLLAKVNETVKKEKTTPRSQIEKIAEGIRERNFSDGVWTEAMNNVRDWLEQQPNIDPLRVEKIIAEIEDSIADFMQTPFANSQLRKAIAEEVKDLDVEIAKVVKEHYTKRSAVEKTLAENLVAKLGLSPAEALIYEKRISKEVAAIFEESRLAEIRKMLGLDENNNPKEKKVKVANRIIDKIMDAINLGVLNDSRFQDFFSEKYNFIHMSPEAVKQLQRFNDLINKHQGSEMSRRYMKQMMDYVQTLKPLDASTFYTMLQTMTVRGMLMGLNTMAVNIPIGSYMSYWANTIPRFFANPVAFIEASKAFKQAQLTGIGRKSFVDIMKTGYNILDEEGTQFEERKDTRGDVVDHLINSYDPKELYKQVKNAKTVKDKVGAIMTAVARTFIKVQQISNFARAFDSLINHRGSEIEYFMREYNEQAKLLGKNKFEARFDPTIAKEVSEAVKKKMGYDQETREAIEEEVDQEILEMKARDETVPSGYKLRRIKARMEEFRDAEKVKLALNYVKTATLMEAPSGVMGEMYQALMENITIKDKENYGSGALKTSLKAMLGFFLRISITSSQRAIENIPFAGLLSPGILYDYQNVDSGKGKRWHLVWQNPRVRNQRLMVHAAVTAIAGLAAMSMFNWDDEEDKLILDPDRWLDITGYGTGKFVGQDQQNALNPSGKMRERKNFMMSIRLGDTWYDILPARFIPQLLPTIAILGGMRDEAELQGRSKEYNDKDVWSQITSHFGDIALATTEQSFNTFPKTIEKMIVAKNKDGGWGVMQVLTEATLMPLRSSIYNNLFKDIYTEVEAARDKPVMTGKFPFTMFKDIPIIEDMMLEGMTDTFGYPIKKTSKVIGALESNPVTNFLIDNLTEFKKINHERYEQKAWQLKMKYHPSLQIPGYWLQKDDMGSEARENKEYSVAAQKIIEANKRHYQNVGAEAYGKALREIFEKNEELLKTIPTHRLEAKAINLPKKAKVYFPEWHAEAMKIAKKAVFEELEKQAGYIPYKVQPTFLKPKKKKSSGVVFQ